MLESVLHSHLPLYVQSKSQDIWTILYAVFFSGYFLSNDPDNCKNVPLKFQKIIVGYSPHDMDTENKYCNNSTMCTDS
jgi:hypothetical protein